MIDRIDLDAKRELYELGREAEEIIENTLPEAQKKATDCRLSGWPTLAGLFNTQAAMLEKRLCEIGKRQQYLIDELERAGEIFYLAEG